MIKLGSSFSEIKLIDKDVIEAGAASLDRKVSNFAKENNLSNFEFLSCIPGCLGGAIIMNSGCYGHDISKVLVSINIIDIDTCQEQEIKQKDIDFFYRGSNLPKNIIITSVKLKGKIEKKELIEKKQNEMIKKKNYRSLAKSKLVVVLLKILAIKKRHGN